MPGKMLKRTFKNLFRKTNSEQTSDSAPDQTQSQLTSSLEHNFNYVKNSFGNSADFVSRPIKIGPESRAMKRETYIQYLQRVYGIVIGKLMGFSYVYFSFIGVTTLLYYFGNFTTTQILTRTPIEMLNLMLAILVMVVVRAGLGGFCPNRRAPFSVVNFSFNVLIIAIITKTAA